MMKSTAASSFTLLATLPSVIAMGPPAELVKRKLMAKSLPDTGEQWSSLPNGIEFQPAANLSPLAKEHLRQLTENAGAKESFQTMFVDGTETYYDEFSQAWRALGFYIDCDYQGDGEDGSASGCQRFMLWAAYVDEAYSGNGAGEYMYYDRNSNQWDDQLCSYANSDRCVKMDCHLPNTHYSLLGFFKEPNYGEWFEQLFNVEGDCLWTDDEYRFMQSFRNVWPQGCTQAVVANSTLYYDLKPSMYGEMEIGLYKDDSCTEEYKGSLTTEKAMRELVCSTEAQAEASSGLSIGALCSIEQSNMVTAFNVYEKKYGTNDPSDLEIEERGDLWGLVSQVDKWNKAFEVFKQCQPCKTYDLTYIVAGEDYQRSDSDDRYNWTSAVMGSDENGLEGDQFRCPEASSDNANQCMKFRMNTRMMTAHWNDVQMAVTQGSIAALTFPGEDDQIHYANNRTFTVQKVNIGKRFAQQDDDFFLFLAALIIMVVSAVLFGWSLYRYKAIKEEADEMMKQPLIASEGIAA